MPENRNYERKNVTFDPGTLRDLAVLGRHYRLSRSAVIRRLVMEDMQRLGLKSEAEPDQADDEPPAVAA